MKNKPRIIIIGSLPPPAIGPSIAMQRLIASSELHDAFSFSFLDISDRRCLTNIGRLDIINVGLGLKHCSQFVLRLFFYRADMVYLGVSQGAWGFLRDLGFILPAILFRRKLVLHLRGSEFRTFYDTMPPWMRWLSRCALSRAIRVIVLGHGLRRVFEGLVPADRVVVIPNGIDYAQFDSPEKVCDGRPSVKRILYLSSLMERKGVFVLLRALPAVLARHPEVEVTIAGLWQSNAERAKADRLLNDLHLRERVSFVGEVTGHKKIHLFHAHDLFVFTPVAPEGLPWVILEAMSAALPVITSAQGAISEVVEHKRTGLIITPEPIQLAESIEWMIEHREQAAEMGRQGRARVVDKFSERLYLSRLVALFREVAELRGRRQAVVDRSERTLRLHED